jgi:hypothetical protein
MEAIVAIAVYTEGVPAGVDLADDVGVASRLLSQDEECRAVACGRKCLEHPSRRHRMGAVIKGERDARFARWSTENDVPVYLERREHHAGRGERAPTERQSADHGKHRLAVRGRMKGKRANPHGRSEKSEASRGHHSKRRGGAI